VSAFRFAGCRHPVDPSQLPAMDRQWLTCGQCGELRMVREVESVRDLAVSGRFAEQTQAADPLEPTGARYVQAAQETVRRLQQAAAKGQVALLVTDAAGVVIVGIRGSGGLTGLRFKQAEGIWDAELHMSGVEILDGSYLLRAPLGWDEEGPEQQGPLFTCPRCGAKSWHPEDARQGYCGRCHDFTARRPHHPPSLELPPYEPPRLDGPHRAPDLEPLPPSEP
jgi:ribosomal protein S27AE